MGSLNFMDFSHCPFGCLSSKSVSPKPDILSRLDIFHHTDELCPAIDELPCIFILTGDLITIIFDKGLHSGFLGIQWIAVDLHSDGYPRIGIDFDFFFALPALSNCATAVALLYSKLNSRHILPFVLVRKVFSQQFLQRLFTWQNCFIFASKNLCVIFWQSHFHNRIILFFTQQNSYCWIFIGKVLPCGHSNGHTSASDRYPDVSVLRSLNQTTQSNAANNYT